MLRKVAGRCSGGCFGRAIGIPIIFMVLAFGYSDQAPAFFRNSIVSVYRALGYPIIGLLSKIFG